MSGKESAKADKKDGDDLTTILDKSQRADLTLLVADITESMRKLILDNFNATAGLDQGLVNKEGMTDDEKMMSADVKADMDKYEKQKKLKAEYEKDLETPKMKNLKKNTLKAFDEWREQVIVRVGKAVDTEDEAKKQIDKSKTSESRPKAPNTTGTVTEPAKKGNNLKFKDLFPPTKTALTKLPMDKRTLILHSILLLLISLEHYNALSRLLLLNLCSSLKLTLKKFEQDEYVTAKGLLENAKELTANEETKKAAEENQEVRKKKVRYAAIAGAAVLGVAGSFAAPLLAAGIGSMASGLGLGTTAAAGYLGSVASSSLLVGSLFGAYGGRMTGQMMDQYAKEIEDFEFMPVHSNQRTSEDPEEGAKQASEHDHKLRVTICLSGWLTEKEEVIKPWRVLGSGAEVFALKYELEALLNLGHSMDGMVQSAAWGYAQRELIQQTVFADLMAAMWPIGLIKVARVLDNPFSVAKNRAEKVGEILAEILIKKAQGERPVTLIGYSLGARAIYVCLQTLAKRRAFGLIENAVLIGAPTPSDTSDWRVLRTAVSGRLVNVYSTNDYLLGFLYRTSSIQYGVSGLQPVEGLPGVENVDASEDVDGHLRYRFLIGGILKKIGFEDVDMQAVEEEQEAMKKMLEEEKKNSLQAQRRRMLRQDSYKKEDGKVDADAEAEAEASDLEKQVKEKTEKSLVSKVIEWWYTPRVPNTQDAEKVAANLQRAVMNPADARATAEDTVRDAQGMAARVYQALPNIPYVGSSGTTGGVAKGDASKMANDATQQTQGYTSRAAAYLPKSMPSMPSMPSIPGYGQKKDTSSEAAKKTKDAGETTKKATNAASETVETTVKNVTNINDNPATKQLKEAPGIKQAVDNDPGVTQTLGKITGAVGTSGNNIAEKVTGATDTATDKAGEAGSKGVDTVDSGAKKVAETGKGLVPGGTSDTKDKDKKQDSKQQQSYSSYAASYIPSIPSWRSAKQGQEKTSKPEDKSAKSEDKSAKPEEKSAKADDKPAPPKLDRKGSSQVKTEASSSPKPKPPKLERKGSSQQNIKSPPPKLGPRKASDRGSGSGTPTGTKSPLQRVSSGTGKENLPNISEIASAPQESAKEVASDPTKAPKKGQEALGGAAEQGKKLASGAASKGQEAVSQPQKLASGVASKGQEAVGGAAEQGQKLAGGAAQKGQEAVSQPPKLAGGAASKGQEALGGAAEQGQKVAGGAASQGQAAAGQAQKAASGVASKGQEAVGGAASKGQEVVGGAASKGQEAAGQVAGQGQKALGQGQQAVTGGAKKATGALGGAFGGGKKMLGFGG